MHILYIMHNKIIKYIQLLYICGTSFCASELLYLLIITCTVHMIQKYLRYMYVVAVYTNVHDICVTCILGHILYINICVCYTHMYACVHVVHMCSYCMHTVHVLFCQLNTLYNSTVCIQFTYMCVHVQMPTVVSLLLYAFYSYT